jgi:hypothetical protein
MIAPLAAQSFREKVSSEIHLETEGLNRYRVFTPFMYDDGDHLSIVLKRIGDNWGLSDEGNSLMRLTYGISERDLHQGTRRQIIDGALSAFSVEDRDGELIAMVEDDRYGDALYSFVQALLKISDVTFLSRERVRSTFLEDLRNFISNVIPENRREFDWHDSHHDPQAMYPVDCHINGIKRPLFLFGLQNDDRARDATIAIMQLRDWDVDFHSIGVFEQQERINRKVLARFSDRCDKMFSALDSNEGLIKEYLDQYTEEHRV